MVKLKEILDSPRLFKKGQIKKNRFGNYTVSILISKHVLDLVAQVTPLSEISMLRYDHLKKAIPDNLKRKVLLFSINFAVDKKVYLMNYKNPQLTTAVLSQVKYFIGDLVRPYNIFEFVPTMEPSKVKVYNIFAKNIQKFIPGLRYVNAGHPSLNIVASRELAGLINRQEKVQEGRFKEIFDSPRLFQNVRSVGQDFDSGKFKVGNHIIEISALKTSSILSNLIGLISVEQADSFTYYARLAPEHKKILLKHFGAYIAQDLKIYDLGFTVNGDYAASLISKPSQQEGLVIITQVVYFLKELVKLLGKDSIFFINYYAFTPERQQMSSYAMFYDNISRIIPGLIPIQVHKAKNGKVPEYVVGTEKARQFLDELVAIPLVTEHRESVRIKELFDANLDIKWHPESNNQLQVAFFEKNSRIYIFRAINSEQKNVGVDLLKASFNVPQNITVWKIGFSYIDKEVFLDFSEEDISESPLEDLMFLIDKNYITGVGDTASVLTGIITIIKQLHKRFPKDVISFRGTEEKSREKVYTMLVSNTKRFAPDCTGKVVNGQYFIVPDFYLEKVR